MESSPPASKPTTSVKLVLLGEAAVGKSSLVLRFVSDDFQENKEPTIGAAFLTQKCSLPNRTIKFEIWDTAGQERFASLAPMYYRNAQSALVVYDVTKPTSFIKARHWVNELKAQASPGIVIALVGNKLDLVDEDDEEGDDAEGQQETSNEDGDEGTGEQQQQDAEDGDGGKRKRKVATEEGQKLADDEGLLFYETSAKSGLNVKQVFLAIANKIPEENLKKTNRNRNDNELNSNDGRVDLNSTNQSSRSSQNCAC